MAARGGARLSVSGSKKKKITKAERLRQLQEEEEKRLREEEEARIKYEKEEMERLEIQRIEDAKWHQLEEKDLERRTEELEELHLLEGCFPEAEKLKRGSRSLSQWKHYIQCDGSPDPSIPQEMNTFISLWKEETNQAFEEVVEKSKLVLHLIEKLKLILLETPPYDLEEKSIIQYQSSILQLQELLHLKFNIATEMLLRQASTLADLDSGNMEKIIQDENVTLYVWANLKKNPRFKNVRFSGTQVGFEIPRVLAASDIALRLLHTRYDHVTPLHPMGAGTEASAAPETEPAKEEDRDAEDAPGQEDQAESRLQENGSSLDRGEEAEAEAPDETEVEMPDGAKGSSAGEQALAEAEEPGGGGGEAQFSKAEGDSRLLLWRRKTSVSEEDSEATNYELEMKLLSETVAAAQLFLVENTSEKPHIFEENEVDLCQFSTLGGVYHLDILELPPQCKPVKGWMIVEILKEGLQKFTYPPETTDDLETENAFPPIEVTLEVHENVIFFEDPMVVRWDAEAKRWKTDGISNVYYRREERLLSFSLETFGPLTLIQDTHVNMPYHSWELRPLEVGGVLLTVTTVFAEIQIQIKENLCMLASVKLSGKEHSLVLEGKWMTPVPFIIALKEAGLNIFPARHSHFYAIMNNKVPLVEMKACRQMALLSSAFAFAWSKWNTLCNSTRVVLKVREHCTEASPEAPSWVLLMFSGDRAQRLKIGEESEAFSETLEEGTEFHSTLYHMVKDFASAEAMDTVRGSGCQQVDAVCHLLLSTRLLSCS